MSSDLLEEYLSDRSRRGPGSTGAFVGAAGGAPCGDLIRIALEADLGRVRRVRFEASGCATAQAAGAAVAELAEGTAVLEAATIGPERIAEALGGLGPHGAHAGELAADALHRALTTLVGAGEPLADQPLAGGRTLVALSGGVDSAVAALLEQRAGREAVAVTLKLWADRHTDESRSCCSPKAVLTARGVAHAIGIPHLTMDLEHDFRARVVDRFVEGHARGRTPNPCVICNGEVRIAAMVALADRLGASHLATGHYARLADDGEGPLLANPIDEAKDQTYMLSGLPPGVLARLRFPLEGLRKPEVRRLAAEAGLEVAGRRESQDLCFLAGEGKRAFLARHGALRDRDGAIVDRAGRSLGRHRGHHHFTVGQRRGIGLAAPEPLYVLATDPDRNTVTVGSRSELAASSVLVRDVTLHRPGSRVDRVRLRYHSPPLRCSLSPAGAAAGRHAEMRVALAEPATAVAPGQTASLLAGEAVVGFGTIARSQ